MSGRKVPLNRFVATEVPDVIVINTRATDDSSGELACDLVVDGERRLAYGTGSIGVQDSRREEIYSAAAAAYITYDAGK